MFVKKISVLPLCQGLVLMTGPLLSLYTRTCSPLLSAAFRNLAPAFAFLPSLFGCLDSSRQRGERAALARELKRDFFLLSCQTCSTRWQDQNCFLAKNRTPMIFYLWDARVYSLSILKFLSLAIYRPLEQTDKISSWEWLPVKSNTQFSKCLLA